MNPELQALQGSFGQAAGRLMEGWLEDIARHDPQSALAMVLTLQDGGFLTISTSASPLTHALSCTLAVTNKAGQMLPLASIDFD